MNTIQQITDSLKAAIDAVPARASELVSASRDKQAELTAAQHADLDGEALDARVADIVERTAASYLYDQRARLRALGTRGGKRRLPEDNRGVVQLGTWGAMCVADPAAARRHLRALIAAAGWTEGADERTAAATIARIEREVAALEQQHAQLVDEAADAGIRLPHLPGENRRREAARLEAERQQRDLELQQQLDTANPPAGRVQHQSQYLASVDAERDQRRRAVNGAS